MTRWWTVGVVPCAVLLAGTPLLARAQEQPAPIRQTPLCEAPVWDGVVPAFDARVNAYIALRVRLEGGQDAAAVSPRILAQRIRAARATAKQGDLFTTALGVEIRKSLRREIAPDTWKMIMDDNPGEIPSQVNDEYREGRPLSTMPPNILAALPRLPAGVEYRFVERHLILLDTRAKLIVDRVPFAIESPGIGRSCR